LCCTHADYQTINEFPYRYHYQDIIGWSTGKKNLGKVNDSEAISWIETLYG